MQVAFVHDWLVSYRGGEKVLEALLDLYPDAPIYTLFYDPESMPESVRRRTVYDISYLRPFRRLRKILLPLYPSLVESFDLSSYDLIISTSSCVAKGVIPAPHARHLCYIHSPMRYIWDQRYEYLKGLRKVPGISLIADILANYLRIWDSSSSHRVDRFVANSRFVGQRVEKFYGRTATIAHPPVDILPFRNQSMISAPLPAPLQESSYFLIAGAFVSYKRFDLAIQAAKKAGVALLVLGSGPEENYLRSLSYEKMSIIIKPDRKAWIDYFQRAKALIFPGIEDFGITAIEAMAAGRPVIAYKAGGALDFIQEGVNGEFFKEASVDSLAKALRDFDEKRYEPNSIQQLAENYAPQVFIGKIKTELKALMET